MRTIIYTTAILMMTAIIEVQAQNPVTKGSGEVFFSETFDWENPEDPKGWTAPDGYYLLDPKDQGTNWQWWKGPFIDYLTQDPMLQSTTMDDGCIALFMERYNPAGFDEIKVDNSIGFPPLDCSEHSSVVVRYETHFMGSSPVDMFLEVSVDNWVHSATYSVNFGCGHKDRPLDYPKGKPAIMSLNISDVAAGLDNVQMRLHWMNSAFYYWAVDDFTLAEAWDNDLRIGYLQMEWNDQDENTSMAWIHNIPKSQLTGSNGFFNFESPVVNFGENDQYGVYLDLDITKNGNSVFNRTSPEKELWVLYNDTVRIEDTYSPEEFGHYKVSMEYKSEEEDDFPSDNKREAYFNVTDSIYSRADDTSELSWSFTKERYNINAEANIEFFNGTIFPIFNDCEVSSISVYISGGKADEFIDYKYSLYLVPQEEDEQPYELLNTQWRQLDSADFNTWVTMPLEKDGESEFLKAGDLVYAGITFNNFNPDYLVRRNKGLEIGTDNSVKLTSPTAMGYYEGNWETGLNDFIGKRNLMIRLNLNDNSNIIDGIDIASAMASLGQNYPNPFRHSTRIDFELSEGTGVSFELKDITGRTVKMVDLGELPSGRHTYDLETNGLEPGIYFYTLKAGSFLQTKRMTLAE